MTFQIAPLADTRFRPLFTMDDDGLRRLGATRLRADRQPGFPCRVSLQDAVPGETVLLVPFAHVDADTPYRASGPVFVREGARAATLAPGDVPDMLRLRQLSLRAYDAASHMVAADLVDGRDVESGIARLFEEARVCFLHVHFAKPGCYACRVDRA